MFSPEAHTASVLGGRWELGDQHPAPASGKCGPKCAAESTLGSSAECCLGVPLRSQIFQTNDGVRDGS